MKLQNTAATWGPVAKSFHWLLAVLILGQLVLGRVADGLRVSPQKFDLFVWHKSIGVTILLLVVLRVLWRLRHAPPAPPPAVSAFGQRVARAGHALLYLLMFAVPLTGWWVSDTSKIPFRLYWRVPLPDLLEANRELSEVAAEAHEWLTTLLLIVVIGHVLAALRHHFLLKDDVLVRMLPFGRSGRN